MRLKLACADFSFPLLTHDASLQLIANLDLQGVDIGLFEKRSHLWPSREFKQLGPAARRLKKKLDNLGLKAADVFLQMDPDFVPYAINHPQKRRRNKARDWFEKTLDYTAALEGRHITTLPGVHFKDAEPRRDSLARSVDELAWRVERAQAYGIGFGVEAHIGSIASRPQAAVDLVARVNGLHLTLDYTHFTRIGLADEAVEPLVQHAGHFHVRGGRKGRLQCDYDQNTIDYKRIYQVLKKNGYKGWIGLEYVWIDWENCNRSDNVSQTALYRDFFRRLAGKK